MHPSSLAWLPLISGVLMMTSPAMAQEDPLAAKRAINLARNSAAAANGGLRLYHPASCMFKDPTDNPCLVQRDSAGFEFQFQGGPPGRQSRRHRHLREPLGRGGVGGARGDGLMGGVLRDKCPKTAGGRERGQGPGQTTATDPAASAARG